MTQQLVLDRSMHFTDLDFLLNVRQFKRVGVALIAIRKALRQRYYERLLAEDTKGMDGVGEDSTPSDEVVDLQSSCSDFS